MTEFIKFLKDLVGEQTQMRYGDMIDIFVDLYGVEMERIYDLTLVEADNVDHDTALHALNTMLIRTSEQFLKEQGIFLDEESIEEGSIFNIFNLVEGVVRIDGWELHDELLAIATNDEQDNVDKFFSLIEEVTDIDTVECSALVESVEDVFFETTIEELNFSKKQFENSFPLDSSELRVYKVDEYVKAVLRRVKHTSLVNTYISNRDTFPVPLTPELIMDLSPMPPKELSLSIAIVTLMQYPEIRDASTLLSKTMDNVALLGVGFNDAVTVSTLTKKLYIELERLYG